MMPRASDEPFLVTGATGFIAGHLIRLLLERGHRVRGTVRDLRREPELRAVLDPNGRHGARLEVVAVELTDDAGWSESARGTAGIFHVASPVPRGRPAHDGELIAPARDGTARVLSAAHAARVPRVVMTSSIAAVSSGHPPRREAFSARDWSLLDRAGPYEKSKTIAERSAWEFVRSTPGGPELVSINPSYVIGPLVGKRFSASLEIIRQLMAREVPGVPDLYFPLVDVRDVAEAHYRAMRLREAAGHRIICNAEVLSLRAIARVLDRKLARRGFRIPRRRLPDWLVRLFALVHPPTRLVVHRLGERKEFDTRPMRDLLELHARSAELSIKDTATSLIREGIVAVPSGRQRPRS